MRKFNIMFARCFPSLAGLLFMIISGVMFMQSRGSYLPCLLTGVMLLGVACICTFLEEIRDQTARSNGK